MWTNQTEFRRAHGPDIEAIMEIERQPGYESLVGRWNRNEHLRNLAAPGTLYLVKDDAFGRPYAFAALSELGKKSGRVKLNRLIVRHAGRGDGEKFLVAIVDTLFGGQTEEIMLNVAQSNDRALRLYRKVGFHEQLGRPQQIAVTPEGRRVTLVLMALKRSHWAEGRPAEPTSPPP